MTKESFFLLFISLGVFPAALGYGLNPKDFLPILYGIEVADNNLSNIFRAIMGLYIGCVLLWIFGAFNKSLTIPALWCMFVFMIGIGLGRALSLILDGMPDMIFVLFMFFEFVAAGITFYLLRGKAQE
tara:strand:- start:1279 stop:1662 length:384 start_codon:yes stop_codon:yes gene_type:complete